jgi:hypothetical protein
MVLDRPVTRVFTPAQAENVGVEQRRLDEIGPRSAGPKQWGPRPPAIAPTSRPTPSRRSSSS